MCKKQRKAGDHFFCVSPLIIAITLLCGCSHLYDSLLANATLEEAKALFYLENYTASLRAYEQAIEQYPLAGDIALFGMGIIYAYPSNDQKDYQKSLECLNRLIKEYPESGYRQDSEVMISYISDTVIKENMITAQQTRIEVLEQEIRSSENEISLLLKRVETLEKKFEETIFLLRNSPADKILIEKHERRLTLMSKGKALKTYKIALGGNPDGPKEREGDNKTPEGIYVIDSRNKDSRYHLSLHISYPNDNDKKRARELGVSPGGNIMIHGLKNGFSWIGDLHSESDWTRGCIAVTDEEIEEIEKLVPDGTIVDIRP